MLYHFTIGIFTVGVGIYVFDESPKVPCWSSLLLPSLTLKVFNDNEAGANKNTTTGVLTARGFPPI
jgi:hypothetical protein